MTLDSPISHISGVRKTTVAALAQFGVRTVRDLLMRFPFRHEDFSRVADLGNPAEGEFTVTAQVKRMASRGGFRRGMSVMEAELGDPRGSIRAVWFNQPYLVRSLRQGATYRFQGSIRQTKFGLQLVSPTFVGEGSPASAAIVPVYSVVKPLTQAVMRRLIGEVLPLAKTIVDPLSEDVRKKFRLSPLADAIHEAHLPASMASRKSAMRRHAFDELYSLQFDLAVARRTRLRKRAPMIPFGKSAIKEFVASLPFPLTGDQRRAAWEAIRDMERGTPMNRLVNGDVGSGKTAVAAIVMRNAAAGGTQSTMMAPTEVLAAQHFATMTRLFSASAVRIALLTGSQALFSARGEIEIAAGVKGRKALLDAFATGNVDIAIGTHALIESGVVFKNLALAVIDEQHRFGVSARRALADKGIGGLDPHLLSLTATPIPRTLAIAAFGDLDVSLLKEKPKHRLPIVTRVVGPAEKTAAYAFVAKEIAAGRQAFVICPLIDPSDVLGVKSVREEFDCLREGPFADVSVAMLHGKMRPKEKDAAMAAFSAGETKMLVATSVIEVGIDVPNATVICIEGAERFGLAQLHQFRGRVGRGARQSHCLLFSDDSGGPAIERLEFLEKCADGFALAERDMAVRGPGELLGDTQSGFSRLRVADIADVELVRQAKDAVVAVMGDVPMSGKGIDAHFE